MDAPLHKKGRGNGLLEIQTEDHKTVCKYSISPNEVFVNSINDMLIMKKTYTPPQIRPKTKSGTRT